MAELYSRIYWRFRDEFADIYADKEAFGWWMTLLMIAEGAHPSAPELPRRIKPALLARLVEHELVTVLPGDRFRCRGVNAEMERRSSQGKAGAHARWMRPQSERNANALPRQDEQRRAIDKTSNNNGLKPIADLLPGVVERLKT
jgi:hypothetical protein